MLIETNSELQKYIENSKQYEHIATWKAALSEVVVYYTCILFFRQ